MRIAKAMKKSVEELFEYFDPEKEFNDSLE
jgi:hypothetical protein